MQRKLVGRSAEFSSMATTSRPRAMEFSSMASVLGHEDERHHSPMVASWARGHSE
jgi:hypothetical protein